MAVTDSSLNLLRRVYNPGYFYRYHGLWERGAMRVTFQDFDGKNIEIEKRRKYVRYYQKLKVLKTRNFGKN
jgi:hypothetical protein